MTILTFLEKFNIKPNNIKIFEEALTHNSYFNEHRAKYLEEFSKFKSNSDFEKSEFVFNYQRLEFLGDAVLQIYISDFLYKKYAYKDQGFLTKTRSDLVREESLAYVAKKIGLGKIIRFGTGELNAKGYEKPSILSDIYESFTAAIYLDQNQNILKNWIESTLIKIGETSEFNELIHDYKSELQEYIQSGAKRDLKYEVIDTHIEEKTKKTVFRVQVKLDNMVFGEGNDFNKQEAERQAAKLALSKLRLE
ncbi:ribonuclease III [Spiroplasma endosymbiont of Labia minor]|uniref:ribonuclease III n=1 Tax=Spiroplasma endosymbiont of Labia minor TaxID=3066305 RepID=UPI0030D0C1EA